MPSAALASRQLTVSNAAVPLSYIAAGIGAMSADCTVETAPIRYTIDGVTTPTVAIGTLVPTGGTFKLTERADVRRFRAIRATGVDALLDYDLRG